MGVFQNQWYRRWRNTTVFDLPTSKGIKIVMLTNWIAGMNKAAAAAWKTTPSLLLAYRQVAVSSVPVSVNTFQLNGKSCKDGAHHYRRVTAEQSQFVWTVRLYYLQGIWQIAKNSNNWNRTLWLQMKIPTRNLILEKSTLPIVPPWLLRMM